MFKPVAALVNQNCIQTQPEQPGKSGQVMVKRLFMLFHGWYGNLFLSKFATGDLDAEGKDRGIKSARMVWENELREFDDETITRAASRCKTDHPEFPPSLPQFVAICRAVRPRTAWVAPQEGQAKLGMSDEARKAHSQKVREAALAKMQKRAEAREGVMHTDGGIAGLRQLIAKAVGLAGGDEVAELRRLETWPAAKAGA